MRCVKNCASVKFSNHNNNGITIHSSPDNMKMFIYSPKMSFSTNQIDVQDPSMKGKSKSDQCKMRLALTMCLICYIKKY